MLRCCIEAPLSAEVWKLSVFKHVLTVTVIAAKPHIFLGNITEDGDCAGKKDQAR